MWPLTASSRRVIAAVTLSLAFVVGWLVNGWLWQRKYNERELEWTRERLQQIDANEKDRERQEKIRDAEFMQFEEARQRLAAELAAARGDTRVIRVCPRAGSARPVPQAGDAIGGVDATAGQPGLSAGDPTGAGAVFDPQWLYEIGAQANALREQVVTLQNEIRRIGEN